MNILHFLCAFLCALFCTSSGASPTSHIPAASSTHEWVSAYVRTLNDSLLELPQNVQLTVPRRATSEQEPLLYAQVHELGMCLITLRTEEHPLTEELESLVPQDLVPLWRQVTLVHELAHCWRWTQHPTALPEGPLDEVFADMAALFWVAQTHPADFDTIHHAYKTLRAKWPNPSHPDVVVNLPNAFFKQTQKVHPFAYALSLLGN